MTSKYIKFGLRADKSLSDLDDPNLALGELLDDISAATDENENPTKFSTEDLSPLIGLRNTGLSDYVNAAGQSVDLASLNGSLVEYTPFLSGDEQEIEPRITIQDYISNFRSVLGNPPWINGGQGPLADFVPSDRINTTLSAATTGDSSSDSIANLGNNLFTTATANFSDIIEGEDFWEDGRFVLSSKIHPSFANSYGLIQWTGFLASNFTQYWESTGLFMIEEDVNDDGNWAKLKSVYSDSITLSGWSWTNGGTILTLGPLNVQNVQNVCVNMKVTIGTTEYRVSTVNAQAGTCAVSSPITQAGVSEDLTFTWSLLDDIIKTGLITFTTPKTTGRVKVRYTVWWPNPNDNSVYPSKRFICSINLRGLGLPYSAIYSEYDRNQLFSVYTYKQFVDNKAGPLVQRSPESLRVNSTISMNYTPPSSISDVVKGMTATDTTIAARTMTIADSYGRLTGNFSGYEVGDWISFETANPDHFAYQIQEINSDNTVAFVDENILTDTSLTVGDPISVITFENLGLIGIYRLDANTGPNGSLYPVGGQTVSATEVYADYIVVVIAHDGQTLRGPLRIISVNGGSEPNEIIVGSYNGGVSTLLNTNSESYYAAVYSTRGLEDLSSVAQCAGVYGREVKFTAVTGATAITLTTSAGVSAGDSVQYEGVITEGTTVATIGSNGEINLSAGIVAALNAAATVVFIKAANIGAYQTDNQTENKEYCVIPLNTAPPFEGTPLGLTTPASNPNLSVRGITFGTLDITIPPANIIDLASSSLTYNRGDGFFPIKYGNTTYKSLINTSG